MIFVGQQLQVLALQQTDANKADTLGRSAFNRFYYASFLCTRDMLGKLNPAWKHTAHAAIPNHLRTAIRKPVKTQLDKNVRNGLMEAGEKSRILTSLQASSEELANLLTSAYAVRIIADYQPEVPINIDGKVIDLEGNKLTTAEQWPHRANTYCSQILKAWRSAGVV